MKVPAIFSSCFPIKVSEPTKKETKSSFITNLFQKVIEKLQNGLRFKSFDVKVTKQPKDTEPLLKRVNSAISNHLPKNSFFAADTTSERSDSDSSIARTTTNFKEEQTNDQKEIQRQFEQFSQELEQVKKDPAKVEELNEKVRKLLNSISGSNPLREKIEDLKIDLGMRVLANRKKVIFYQEQYTRIEREIYDQAKFVPQRTSPKAIEALKKIKTLTEQLVVLKQELALLKLDPKSGSEIDKQLLDLDIDTSLHEFSKFLKQNS